MDNDEKRIGVILERTTRIAKLAFGKVFKKMNIDLTPEQWILLDMLYLQGEMTQKEIGNSSFKDAPTISRIIDNLVKKQLVYRVSQEADRRKSLISLSPKGTEIVTICKSEVNRLRMASWDGLTEADYDHFLKIMDRIFTNFENT